MGLLIIILIVAVVALFFRLSSVSARLEHVERYLMERTQAPANKAPSNQSAVVPESADTPELVSPDATVPVESTPSSGVEPPSAQPVTQTQVAQVSREPEPDALGRFVEWCKEDWLTKVGALLLLGGMGWFVGYAFTQGWIGPFGRVLLGLGCGALLAGFGYIRARRPEVSEQGTIFLVLGSSVILATVFAAQTAYDMFPAMVAVAIMGVSVAFVAFSSVVYSRFPVALTSLLMAALVPFLSSADQPSFVWLMSYLFVVTLGTVWVVWLKAWHSLIPVAFFAVAFHSLLWLPRVEELGIDLLALIFAFVFGAVYLMVATIGLLKHYQDTTSIASYLWTSVSVGVYVLIWIMVAGGGDLRAVYYLLWAIAIMIAGVHAFLQTKLPLVIATYAALAGSFVVAATSVLFDGPTFVLVYTLETAVFILLIQAFVRRPVFTNVASLAFIGPVILALPSIGAETWQNGFWHRDFAVTGLILLSSSLIAWYFYHTRANEDGLDQGMQPPYQIFFATSLIFLYLITWLLCLPYSLPIFTQLATLETLLVVMLVWWLSRDGVATQLASGLFVLPFFASLASMTATTWDMGILHADSLALLVLAGVTMYLGLRFYCPLTEPEAKEWRPLSGIFALVATFYTFVWVWLALHALLPDAPDQATTVALIFYTIVGVVAYVRGTLNNHRPVILYGGTIVGLVILRLLLVDVWSMDLVGRIVTFITLGVVLMSTAFLRLGKTSTAIPREKGDQASK